VNDLERKLTARLADKRSRRVIFLSHCLLNENTRFLGGACYPGCVPEVARRCLDQEAGIVQMPCPEQLAWGGVLKPYLLFAYGLRSRHPMLYRFRRLLTAPALAYTRFRYRHLAKRVADKVSDYLRSGMAVETIVGVDGSPSCGVRTTIEPDVLEALYQVDPSDITAEWQRRVLRDYARPGRGVFIEELQRQLERHSINIAFTAHDLFSELDSVG
jgi:predicted secreted protein